MTAHLVDKTDYKQKLRQFYTARTGQPVVVQVPVLNYLMIDGRGDPNTSQDYIDAIQALYPVAYTLKFMCKQERGSDFIVMPLEGLWWTADMHNFATSNKDDWLWTAMIMQPDIVSSEQYERAVQQVGAKKNPKALNKLRLQAYDEGRAAQVMYIGPYTDEGETIQQLHAFITASGGELTAASKHHHEIYMSDPRRTDPTKLKTIIRQPF